MVDLLNSRWLLALCWLVVGLVCSGVGLHLLTMTLAGFVWDWRWGWCWPSDGREYNDYDQTTAC